MYAIRSYYGKAFRYHRQVPHLGGCHGRKPVQGAIHKGLKLIPVLLELVIHDIIGDALHPPGFRNRLEAAEQDAIGFRNNFV